MKRETTIEGSSVEEALDKALEELGVQQDAVEYEVLEETGRRLFGLGAERQAKVRVWLRDEFIREMESGKGLTVDGLPAEGGASPGASEEGLEEGAGGVSPPVPGGEVAAGLSEEELDNVADEAVGTLQAILASLGIDADIEEYEGDEGEIILDIVGDDLGVLIGRHGKTLDGLQVLTSAITNRRLGFRYPVLVDVEGYRNRRRAKLEDIARRAADRASRQGEPIRLRPMPSPERRVVHVCLRDDARVATQSEGEEPFRAVLVVPRKR